jgi:hypothetical protein
MTRSRFADRPATIRRPPRRDRLVQPGRPPGGHRLSLPVAMPLCIARHAAT